MTKRNPDGTGLTRREAIRKGAGALLGATAMLAGTGELASLAAQGPGNNVQATPLPATDPRFPMPPTWNRELRQLAPNVYAYTQGGGPTMSRRRIEPRHDCRSRLFVGHRRLAGACTC